MGLNLEAAPNAVCILRLSAIGDTCHALPVVRTLQAAWPNTRITWIIGKIEAMLLSDIPEIEFVVLDKSRGWRAFADVRRVLRNRHFDLLLAMHASMRANITSLLVPTQVRIGFDQARAKDYQWLFTTDKIPAKRHQHVMDGLFEFAEYVGIKERVLRWDIPLSEADEAFAADHLKRNGPVLVISPCSSQRFRNFRNWKEEHYAAVADYAAQRYSAKVILTGSPSRLEQSYGARISTLAKCAPTNLIGQTTLKQLLALLTGATALICPDSGPAHMATAVRTPVIGLYATSNPGRTGPYFSQRWVINKYPQAVAEEFGKSVEDVPWGGRVRDPQTMELIKVDQVTAKLDQLLGSA